MMHWCYDICPRIQGNSSTDQFGDKTIRRQGRTIRWTIGTIRQHDRTIRWQFYQFGDKTIRQQTTVAWWLCGCLPLEIWPLREIKVARHGIVFGRCVHSIVGGIVPYSVHRVGPPKNDATHGRPRCVPLSMTLNVSTWSFSTSECGTGSAKDCSCTSSFGVNVGSSGFIEELSLEKSCCMGATAVCSRGNGVMQSHSKHSSRCWRKADCSSLSLTLTPHARWYAVAMANRPQSVSPLWIWVTWNAREPPVDHG